jgi:hypothetical protein
MYWSKQSFPHDTAWFLIRQIRLINEIPFLRYLYLETEINNITVCIVNLVRVVHFLQT